MEAERHSTPPPKSGADRPGALPRGPLTPEQLRKIVCGHLRAVWIVGLTFYLQEINRMRAKAIREQREAEEAKRRAAAPTSLSSASGVKRTYSSMTASETPATLRDASANRPLDAIKPARNFTKYVDYDFSKMTDTKGGFLTQEDDPYNKALNVRDGNEDQKPTNMTQKEWERQQLLDSLRRDRAGPFEPGLSVLEDKSKQKTCRECGSLEIDWKWEEILRCSVCHACKEKYPEKYSLLTKTEAKEDYLLTDRESIPDSFLSMADH
jgi:DNA-repair protein complementing XP-A cells